MEAAESTPFGNSETTPMPESTVKHFSGFKQILHSTKLIFPITPSHFLNINTVASGNEKQFLPPSNADMNTKPIESRGIFVQV